MEWTIKWKGKKEQIEGGAEEVKEENKRRNVGGKGSRRSGGKEGRDKDKINSGAEDERQRRLTKVGSKAADAVLTPLSRRNVI